MESAVVGRLVAQEQGELFFVVQGEIRITLRALAEPEVLGEFFDQDGRERRLVRRFNFYISIACRSKRFPVNF